MTRRRGAGLRVARLIVAVAATIVGRRRRSEWRREWEAELWVASEQRRPVVRDALGAFRHALAVRRHTRFDAPGSNARRLDANRRALEHVRFSWLDVKLGLRMLAKYPGLSSVSVIGMSVAIAIGVGVFSIFALMLQTSLPLPDGDRVVALRNAIVTEPGRNRASLSDFAVWRAELGSVSDVAAFTTTSRNLVIPDGGVRLVRVVRMTASGFTLARTTPLMGRPLLEEDERTDARVMVIAFEEWQRRFAADPHVVGRRVGLGGDAYTIVGVMPEGFRFPVDDRYWIPLVFGPAERANADAVSVTIAARLAEGATLESAQAELSGIGTGMAAASPDTHEYLRPRVLHYTRAFFDMDSPEMVWTVHLFRIVISLLLVVVAVNVAILVYARTATRAGELAVRTALGASRARVVTQLFAEALVLSGAAGLAGLAIAGVVLEQLRAVVEREAAGSIVGFELAELPFWVNLGLSTKTIAYALVLALVGALIVGVVPALKATGRRVQTSLQQLAGRSGRMQLGRAWTALIIGQVATAVATLPFAAHFTEEMVAYAWADAQYPAEEFVEASLAMDRAYDQQDTTIANAMQQRFRARAALLIERLESDPAVAGLTVRIPGSYERIELDNTAAASADGRPIEIGSERIDRIGADFFALYEMPIVAGRAFREADARAGATAVIVNQVFAEDYLGGSGAAVGRLLRFPRESDVPGEVEPGPWFDIVGVVRDFESHSIEPSQRIYLAADIAQLPQPTRLAIRVRGDMAGFAQWLRKMATEVDPLLQLHDVINAAVRHTGLQQGERYMAIGALAVTLSVLLLSGAGIYAMMSFTVARRRREIGIRSALGAAPRTVLRSIFARASAQIGGGILFGVIGTVALDRMTGRGPVHDGNSIVVLMIALLMTTVGLLAAIGPARRGLAVQPTEALREE